MAGFGLAESSDQGCPDPENEAQSGSRRRHRLPPTSETEIDEVSSDMRRPDAILKHRKEHDPTYLDYHLPALRAPEDRDDVN